tara:strand:+ start:11539 stop:12054 length:516 start_codon:yes stop_codon:yes gene_type:complete
MTTLEDVEKLYEAVLDDANKGDYSASMFLKHCDPYEWLSEGERAKAVAKADDDDKADDDVDFYGQEGAGLNIIEIYNARKASPIDYAEMHREEKALLKVKQRGRKKQRKKNRRLRENRDKELREKKRLLRKKVAEKNEKKKQSKRERKRFSPISKEIRMLDESIKDGFALK